MFDPIDVALTCLSITLVPYLIIGLIVLLRGRKSYLKKDYLYHPTVSIFLPTFNEKANIARKLDNLLQQTYPISEILVYDCSTDNTREIVGQYQKKYPNIKLIRQKNRIGVARSLNYFFREASGEILVKTDCDTLVKSRNALRDLVADFSDERIGGVSGVCVNVGLEGYFRKFLTRLQITESNIDSTIVAHATSLVAYRKSVVADVNPNSVNDDAEEFVLIRRKGFRTIIDPNVIAEEEIPDTLRKRRIQKDRRAEGTIRVLLRNASIFFNPRYGLYGLIIFPMDFFLLVISPLIILFDLISVGYILFIINPMLLVAPITLLLFVIVLFRANMAPWLIALVDLHLSGLMGAIRLLLGGEDSKWEQVRN